eukprot:TCONS_00054433-protein
MIPNFENNSAPMTNSYGYQPVAYGENGLPYNEMASSQQTDGQQKEGHKYATGNKTLPYYGNSTFKDPNPFFSTFQPNFHQRFTHFGASGLGYFPNPYLTSFYDRMHEMEAKIPLEYARVWLDHQTLWRRFSVCGNEMIITKMGRRMFPVLSFGVHSLNFTDLYTMEVEVIPSDNNRYKYVSVTGWRVNGVASQQEGNKRMYHPEGIQTGEYWQKNGVAFKRIKLTNKKTAKEGSNNIVLNSMHKYHIQLVIKQIGLDDQVLDTKKFEFKETEFIAVTAYQNDDVTQLKIDHNPFAKAFRDNANEHCERSQYTDIYMTQPKRRKCQSYDEVTNQTTNHVMNDPILVDNSNNNSNTTNEATFSLPLMNNENQSVTEEDKNRLLMNFNNDTSTSSTSYTNALTNFSSFNCNSNDYNNSMNWFQPINFESHDIEEQSNLLSTQHTQSEQNLHSNEVSTITNAFHPQKSPTHPSSESIDNEQKPRQTDIVIDLSKSYKSVM